MKVIVDTSVWSLAFRRTKPSEDPQVEKLRKGIESGEEIMLLGVILMEVLQGVREKKQSDRLKEALSPFEMIEPSRDDYIFAAKLRNQCASRGIQASTVDFLIAGTSIRQEAFLLTTDEDFRHIAGASPLKLL